MPVLLSSLPDPTDLVMQGEQLRMSLYDREPEQLGSIMAPACVCVNPSVLADEDSLGLMNVFVESNRMQVRRSKTGELQMRANGGVATTAGAWVWNDWAPLVSRIAYSPTIFVITGTSRDNTGAALANCEVRVFDGSNNFMGQTISDGSGAWSMSVPTNSGPFWARYYLAGSPNRGGTTDYFQVPG